MARPKNSVRLNGIRVKDLRRAMGSGVTQEYFVGLQDVRFSLSTLQRMERGESVSKELAEELADALGVELTDIVDDNSESASEKIADSFLWPGTETIPTIEFDARSGKLSISGPMLCDDPEKILHKLSSEIESELAGSREYFEIAFDLEAISSNSRAVITDYVHRWRKTTNSIFLVRWRQNKDVVVQEVGEQIKFLWEATAAAFDRPMAHFLLLNVEKVEEAEGATKASFSPHKNIDVLVIYAGGTIGSAPTDPRDEASPQITVDWEDFLRLTPCLREETLGFRLGFEKLSEIVDSCNVGPECWVEIAEIIERNYDDCTGFVVLHGTDTMVYTASALSFMLANLSKPVVLTGGHRSHLFQARNDCLKNLLNALAVANPIVSGIPVIPEVMISFGSEVLRGNRARKFDAIGHSAYDTPNYPPLAKIGAIVKVDQSRILPCPDEDFFIRRNLDLNVIELSVFPGVDNQLVDRLFEDKQFRPSGVVVRSYGAGNLPTDTTSTGLFTKLIQDNGVTMINVTQSVQGSVDNGLYETANTMLASGMLSGSDLTPESALIKLMIGLGDKDLRHDVIGLRNFLQTNQVGEQSASILEIPLPSSAKSIKHGGPMIRLQANRLLPGSWKPSDLEGAQLRLFGAKATNIVWSPPAEDEAQPVDFYVYVDVSSTDGSRGSASPVFIGHHRRTLMQKSVLLSFDVLNATKRLFRPSQRAAFGLLLSSERCDLEWERAELALFTRE